MSTLQHAKILHHAVSFKCINELCLILLLIFACSTHQFRSLQTVRLNIRYVYNIANEVKGREREWRGLVNDGLPYFAVLWRIWFSADSSSVFDRWFVGNDDLQRNWNLKWVRKKWQEVTVVEWQTISVLAAYFLVMRHLLVTCKFAAEINAFPWNL